MAAAGATSLPSVPPPAPEMQREMIAEAMKLEMKQGQVWYVLGSKWWQLWQAYVRFGEQAAAEPAPTPPGGGYSLAPTPTAGSAPPAAAASAAVDSRSNSNSSSMDEDGVMVKAEQEAGYGVVVKTDANEHRVAGLSLEEEGARGSAGAGGGAKVGAEQPQRASPGPIDNRALGEGRELREGMMEGEDYVLLLNRAYELLEAWYGGGPHFKRWVVSLGSNTHTQLTVELFPVKFMVYTCLPDGKPDKDSLKVQLYSREKTMRQVCADVKSSLNLTPKVDTRLSLKKLEAEEMAGGAAGAAAAAAAGVPDEAEDDGWQAIHLEEVSQLLHEVMGDTQTVALLVETKDTSDPNASTTFPRDHILLRWRLNLKVGDLLDARDSDKNWFESRITKVDVEGDPTRVRVHFLGWSEKWDEEMDRTSENLQKLHTFTTPWRQDLQVNSKCEVSSSREDVKKWYSATVGAVKYEDGKRLLHIEVSDPEVGSQWLPEDSENICKVNTHINKPQDSRTISRARSDSGGGTGSSYTFYRTNTKAKPITRGAVGLSNLGNTCFMNSMLQCLLATESFSTYFRNQHWKREVNEDNPLGMSGKMAAAYAGLTDDAWSGEFSVVVPNTVKKVVSQYAPMFAGYQQHDASELMSFLLDGIHEDLNRVHKKPYVETVDSAGRADLVVAEESWRRYLMRNDSVMVDTCTGLLRSHVTCPECKLSSVTFDPYTSLSLPLPVDTAVMVKVLFHPLPYGTRPVEIAVTLEKSDTVRTLKTAICKRYNEERASSRQQQHSGSGGGDGARAATEDCLAVIEVWSCRVFKGLDDSCPLSEMKSTDDFAVCQLEYPLVSPDASGGSAASASDAASAASTSPPAGGAGGGGGSSSSSGQTSSQGTGEADGKSSGGTVAGAAAAAAAGEEAGGGGGGASVLIDLVLSTHPNSPLKGKPQRITCRHGVTNNEVHAIIRRHLSRFVPSLKPAVKESPCTGEVPGGEQMAGISSTSDIDSDYVHVTDPMALDGTASSTSSTSTTISNGGGGGGGDSSPYVHVKKTPAAVVISDGDGDVGEAASPAAMEVEDDGVWSGGGGGGSTVAGSGAAVLVSSPSRSAGAAAEGEQEGRGGAKGKGKVKGNDGVKSAEEVVPYTVVVSDYSGGTTSSTKGVGNEVPANDAVFAIVAPRSYAMSRSSGHESTTVKIQFRQDDDGSLYKPHSSINETEMDAADCHPSVKEAEAAHSTRQSVPIDSCFEKFTECEQLGQSELWYCSRCKTHRQASKKLDVYTAPDVLIVVLKRFLFTPGTSMVYRQKLDTHVSFPIKGLDLTSKIRRAGGPISEEAPPIYDLYAVSEHSGSLRAGHYTAIAQNFEDKRWYSFNDSQVSPTTPDKGPSSEPYVLFYRRRRGILRWAGMGRDEAV